MKYNKAISLTFTQNNPNASVNISVPILVKRIKCKTLAYTGEAPSLPEYVFVFSDLTGNSPIGMFYDDPTQPISMGQNVEFVFQNPQLINGLYTFSLKELNLTPYLPFDINGGIIGMILEFDDEDEQ